ncbi:Gfo/Idh/MocA family protein [Brevibacillus ginsengisoli]|uniref:Gfo/Idh/MocA family protein n=1 Tax=Brevibacillus ginsengisoli TaxID=363854 RepID=UPI003CEE8CD5
MSKETGLIRVGIIGTGGVGEKLLRTFHRHPETEVRAICDLDQARIAQLSQEIGGVSCYTDYRELLERDDLDVIYLGVPPKLHHGIALAIIHSKRHILCEKPLANSLEEAEEMAEAAAKAGIVHAMNFPTYYRKAYREMAARIERGEIGRVRRIEVQGYFPQWPRVWQQNAWIAGREQGGFVREVMPHYIHLIQKLFGPITQVNAQLEYPNDPHECETGIIASLKLADGTHVLMNGLSQMEGEVGEERISFTIYGTRGRISLVNWGQLEVGIGQESPVRVELEAHHHLAEEVDWVVQAIKGKPADIIDFAEGLRVQKVLEQLLGV